MRECRGQGQTPFDMDREGKGKERARRRVSKDEPWESLENGHAGNLTRVTPETVQAFLQEYVPGDITRVARPASVSGGRRGEESAQLAVYPGRGK